MSPASGNALITRRAINEQPKEDGVALHGESIFHTQCIVEDKVCTVVIDLGSCTNLASSMLV